MGEGWPELQSLGQSQWEVNVPNTSTPPRVSVVSYAQAVWGRFWAGVGRRLDTGPEVRVLGPLRYLGLHGPIYKMRISAQHHWATARLKQGGAP